MFIAGTQRQDSLQLRDVCLWRNQKNQHRDCLRSFRSDRESNDKDMSSILLRFCFEKEKEEDIKQVTLTFLPLARRRPYEVLSNDLKKGRQREDMPILYVLI